MHCLQVGNPCPQDVRLVGTYTVVQAPSACEHSMDAATAYNWQLPRGSQLVELTHNISSNSAHSRGPGVAGSGIAGLAAWPLSFSSLAASVLSQSGIRASFPAELLFSSVSATYRKLSTASANHN